ncbi:hypothetical protein [Streptomyces sulphureus]|uniref:hypothetical protein n=1 Tax=Streptomyces sulphureus TaxID=47758 RepID=UPI00036D7AD0|nr:hypothetical protein [Streptomyces sulphureus]
MRKIATATACGMATGVVFTVTTVEDVPTHGAAALLLSLASRVLPVIIATILITCAFQNWMTKREAAEEQRRRQEEQLQQRANHLDLREEALNHAREAIEERIALLTKHLEENQIELLTEREGRTKLQTDYDELVEEHNRMVIDVLQHRADAFARPTAAPVNPSAPLASVRHIVVRQYDNGVTQHELRNAVDPHTG